MNAVHTRVIEIPALVWFHLSGIRSRWQQFRMIHSPATFPRSSWRIRKQRQEDLQQGEPRRPPNEVWGPRQLTVLTLNNHVRVFHSLILSAIPFNLGLQRRVEISSVMLLYDTRLQPTQTLWFPSSSSLWASRQKTRSHIHSYLHMTVWISFDLMS